MRKFYRDRNSLILDGGFTEQRSSSRMASRNPDGACPTFVTLYGLANELDSITHKGQQQTQCKLGKTHTLQHCNTHV